MIAFGSPFRSAWKRTEVILFQTGNFTKWLCLGFTAWLAGFLEQSGSSGSQAFPGDDIAKSMQSMTSMGLSIGVAIFCGVVVLILLTGFLFIWLGSRGQFMFLDNLVGNRSEVVRPWRVFRQKGNRLAWVCGLVFTLGIFLGGSLLLAALIYCWPDFEAGRMRPLAAYLPLIIAAIAVLLFMFPIGVVMFFYRELGVPIMYAGHLGAGAAARRIWTLATEYPLDFLVYLILRLAMGFVFILIGVVLGCLTCCLGFIPFVSTVLTLPLRVFRTSYTLDCLTQWVPELDFWKTPDDDSLLPLTLP